MKRKRIHILRPARGLRDGNGQIVNIDDRVIREVAESYDARRHTAPLVLGHPRHDAPAYGHVGRIEVDADGAHAVPSDVSAALAEHYNARRFTRISASLYRPGNPNNPTPGKWHLKHVGFLGAATPVIKGLQPPVLGEAPFAGGEGDLAVEIDLADAASPRPHVFGGLARVLRGLREWIVSEHDVETADRLIGNHDIEALSAEESRMRKAAAAAMETSSYADPDADPASGGVESTETGGAEMAQNEKTPEQLQTELAEARAENERLARAADRASVDRDVADLAESTGNVTDAERAVIAAVLAALPDGEDAASADFAEGDGARLSPRAGALAVLKSIAGRAKNRAATPPITGEIAAAGRGDPPANLAEAPLDAEAQRRIGHIMRTENLSFGQALNKALAG